MRAQDNKKVKPTISTSVIFWYIILSYLASHSLLTINGKIKLEMEGTMVFSEIHPSMDSWGNWGWIRVMAEVTQCFWDKVDCAPALSSPGLLCTWVSYLLVQLGLPGLLSGFFFSLWAFFIVRLSPFIFPHTPLGDRFHSLSFKYLLNANIPQVLISSLELH